MGLSPLFKLAADSRTVNKDAPFDLHIKDLSVYISRHSLYVRVLLCVTSNRTTIGTFLQHCKEQFTCDKFFLVEELCTDNDSCNKSQMAQYIVNCQKIHE